MLINNRNNYASSVNGIFKTSLLGDIEYAIQTFKLPGIEIGHNLLMTSDGPLTLGGYKLSDSNNTVIIRLLLDEKLQVWLHIYNKFLEYMTKNTPPESDAFINLFDNNHNIFLTVFLKNSKLSSITEVEYEVGTQTSNVLTCDLTLAFDKIYIS